MSTTTLFSWIIIAQSVTSQTENACIWGRDEAANDVINGQFVFQGYFNEAPWYKKEYGLDIRYMFLVNGYYVIADEAPNNNPAKYARCTISTSYPWQCALNQWEVYNSDLGWNIDPAVYCKMGSCPEWICDAITTDIEYMGCDDTFSQQVAANAWSNINGDRFFYFNYIGFNWCCDEEITYTSDKNPTDLLSYAEQIWIDATKGSSVYIQFVTPFNQAQVINCVQNPTKEPTSAPTYFPTSNPSQLPSTTNPTLFPSDSPTRNPLIAPSSEPTAYPSSEPTTNPITTANPSKLPTNVPVLESTAKADDESSTTHANDADNEAVDKHSLDLFPVVIAITASLLLCACVLTLILCVVLGRKKKAKHIHNVAKIQNKKDELPQQQIAQEINVNPVISLQLQEVKIPNNIDEECDDDDDDSVRNKYTNEGDANISNEGVNEVNETRNVINVRAVMLGSAKVTKRSAEQKGNLFIDKCTDCGQTHEGREVNEVFYCMFCIKHLHKLNAKEMELVENKYTIEGSGVQSTDTINANR